MLDIKNQPIGELIRRLAPCTVDLGARGGFDEDMLPVAWATHVIGFEPEPEEASRLEQFGDSRWKEMTVLPYAVGGHTGPAVLYMPDSAAGASLLPHDSNMAELFGYPNLHIDTRQLNIQTVTLDELQVAGKLPRVDYMKIDIEGAELDALMAASNVLQDCVALKVECSFLPQRIHQPLVWEVASFVLKQNFAIVELHDIHRWRRRNLPAHPYRVDFEMGYSRGQVAQCDLIALRAPETVRTMDQALRLVIISAVLGYFDYAITVMRIKPELEEEVKLLNGFSLEHELKVWARSKGRYETEKAIRRTLRGLVPLIRSWVGKLPYEVPVKPY